MADGAGGVAVRCVARMASNVAVVTGSGAVGGICSDESKGAAVGEANGDGAKGAERVESGLNGD